jgi:hypothetical protein
MTQVLTSYKCTLFIYFVYTYPPLSLSLPFSLALFLSMARGILFPCRLRVLIVVVLVHQICSAEDCPHASCGNIRNISYPFRLEGDPKTCGDQRYTLSCENNETVLNLYNGRYYVQEINYISFTIRVVDPGILNDTNLFIPRYSLDYTNFSSGDPYRWRSYTNVVIVNCEKPLNSGMYAVDNSTCFKNGVYSSPSSLSHSRRYTYVLVDAIWDLEDLCQVEQVSLTSWSHQYGDDDLRNMSCTDIHNELLRGFELFWYQVYCGSCGRYDTCHVDEAKNASCSRNGA